MFGESSLLYYFQGIAANSAWLDGPHTPRSKRYTRASDMFGEEKEASLYTVASSISDGRSN